MLVSILKDSNLPMYVLAGLESRYAANFWNFKFDLTVDLACFLPVMA